jgi:hypothetical protein
MQPADVGHEVAHRPVRAGDHGGVEVGTGQRGGEPVGLGSEELDVVGRGERVGGLRPMLAARAGRRPPISFIPE